MIETNEVVRIIAHSLRDRREEDGRYTRGGAAVGRRAAVLAEAVLYAGIALEKAGYREEAALLTVASHPRAPASKEYK